MSGVLFVALGLYLVAGLWLRLAGGDSRGSVASMAVDVLVLPLVALMLLVVLALQFLAPSTRSTGDLR